MNEVRLLGRVEKIEIQEKISTLRLSVKKDYVGQDGKTEEVITIKAFGKTKDKLDPVELDSIVLVKGKISVSEGKYASQDIILIDINVITCALKQEENEKSYKESVKSFSSNDLPF